MANDQNTIPDEHYDSLAALETKYWWHRSRLYWARKIIQDHWADPSRLDVVDYGCGTGGFLHSLNQELRFKSALGVDISTRAISLAQKYGGQYRLVGGEGVAELRSADLVLLMDVLEHIENDEAFMKRIIQEIKPGAHVLVSVPAGPFFYSGWDKGLGHHRRYSLRTLADVLTRSGAQVKYISYGFSYLAPFAFLRKMVLRLQGPAPSCEFPPVPGCVDQALLGLNALEVSLLKYTRPFLGTSLFCLAFKA